MTNEQIENLLENQRKFYRSGATISVDFRIEQLKKLYATVKKYEIEINDALQADLGKSHYERITIRNRLLKTVGCELCQRSIYSLSFCKFSYMTYHI